MWWREQAHERHGSLKSKTPARSTNTFSTASQSLAHCEPVGRGFVSGQRCEVSDANHSGLIRRAKVSSTRSTEGLIDRILSRTSVDGPSRIALPSFSARALDRDVIRHATAGECGVGAFNRSSRNPVAGDCCEDGGWRPGDPKWQADFTNQWAEGNVRWVWGCEPAA
jgi:hypothetical protein